MELGPWIFLLVGFAFPAFIFYLVFRAAARIQRPVEGNVLHTISAIVMAGAVIHCLVVVLLFLADLAPLPAARFQPPAGWDFLRLLSIEGLLQQVETEVRIRHLSDYASLAAIESGLAHFLAYIGLTSAVSVALAVICSKLCIYGVWPFKQIFQGYYGGLYDLYQGWLYHPVEASIMSNHKVGDDKFVIYRGITTEVRLTATGYIDHVIIAAPQKLIVCYDASLGNLKGQTSEFIDVDGSDDDDDFSNNRLQIEGEDIANIFYKRLDDFIYEGDFGFWVISARHWIGLKWRDFVESNRLKNPKE